MIAILTPANLFTGVLACGCICLHATWADLKCLPPGLRLPRALMALNVAGGLFFLLLGLKSYWDYDSVFSWILLGATVLLGTVGALLVERWLGKRV